MERLIPDLYGNKLVSILFDYEREERTAKKYVEHMEAFEKECEEELLDVLSKLNIAATIKDNRYSLPYQKEIFHSIRGGSELAEAFNFKRVMRGIVQELLMEDIYKMRFYVYINIVEHEIDILDIIPSRQKYGIGKTLNFGALEYRFRYYVHDN